MIDQHTIDELESIYKDSIVKNIHAIAYRWIEVDGKQSAIFMADKETTNALMTILQHSGAQTENIEAP